MEANKKVEKTKYRLRNFLLATGIAGTGLLIVKLASTKSSTSARIIQTSNSTQTIGVSASSPFCALSLMASLNSKPTLEIFHIKLNNKLFHINGLSEITIVANTELEKRQLIAIKEYTNGNYKPLLEMMFPFFAFPDQINVNGILVIEYNSENNITCNNFLQRYNLFGIVALHDQTRIESYIDSPMMRTMINNKQYKILEVNVKKVSFLNPNYEIYQRYFAKRSTFKISGIIFTSNNSVFDPFPDNNIKKTFIEKNTHPQPVTLKYLSFVFIAKDFFNFETGQISDREKCKEEMMSQLLEHIKSIKSDITEQIIQNSSAWQLLMQLLDSNLYWHLKPDKKETSNDPDNCYFGNY